MILILFAIIGTTLDVPAMYWLCFGILCVNTVIKFAMNLCVAFAKTESGKKYLNKIKEKRGKKDE